MSNRERFTPEFINWYQKEHGRHPDSEWLTGVVEDRWKTWQASAREQITTIDLPYLGNLIEMSLCLKLPKKQAAIAIEAVRGQWKVWEDRRESFEREAGKTQDCKICYCKPCECNKHGIDM